MLYNLYEAQRASLAPFRISAQWWHDWSHATSNPWRGTPLNEVGYAASDITLRLTQDYPKQPFGISEVAGHSVKEAVVKAQAFCDLLHFEKNTKNPGQKVLLCAPLSGHHATLLRDTAKTLLQDHDVYITDWKDAKHVPLAKGDFGFDDYVEWIIACIHSLSSKNERINVVSVCQPTVPVLCAISLMAARKDPLRPKAMVMMGGPIDTRHAPSEVNNFATERDLSWFKKTVIDTVPAQYAGHGRRVYPGFLQYYGFVAMNPSRHMKAHIRYFNDLVRGSEDSAESHRDFYDEYNAVLDMPASYYLETIERVFQDFHLPLGKMQVRGELVKPEAITDIALFTIEGELDDISCPGQTEAAHSLCSNIPKSKRQHLLQDKVGHYGIFSGTKYRTLIYPQIKDFLAKH